MPVALRVQVRGRERYARFLERVEPRRNPELTRRIFGRAGDRLEDAMESELSGPRGPRRLGVVTGELRRSVTQDRARLEDRVEVGVPADLFWYELHELGYGRYTRRPAIERALDEALPEIERETVRVWEAYATS